MSGGEADATDRLIKNTDLALYRAKTDGRGTFRFFEAEMDARVRARSALEVDLRQALAKGQFTMHYQPQVDIETHEIVGFEALLRWHHPERGFVPPAEFIPLAEETGIIMRLGEWVLRRACTDAQTWSDSVRVAVNVSPAQFRNQDLSKVVAQALQETGLSPNRLEIEITESLLMRDIEANLAALRELKALGVRVAMDDFGTGYSSLRQDQDRSIVHRRSRKQSRFRRHRSRGTRPRQQPRNRHLRRRYRNRGAAAHPSRRRLPRSAGLLLQQGVVHG
jgi:predicted signal transduction protein with EAL and GGDEF domain